VVVLRPDGWVGTTVELGESVGEKLLRYFGQFLVAAAGSRKVEAKL
jgi:phenol 2-monooxygenase